MSWLVRPCTHIKVDPASNGAFCCNVDQARLSFHTKDLRIRRRWLSKQPGALMVRRVHMSELPLGLQNYCNSLEYRKDLLDSLRNPTQLVAESAVCVVDPEIGIDFGIQRRVWEALRWVH